MIKKLLLLFTVFNIAFLHAQINTDKVMIIGRNALYYEDYILSIQYFNQVIRSKPYQAEPYFYRAIAKFYLDDIKGAEDDCTLCLERNPFLTNAYQLRGDARLNLQDYDGAIGDYKKVMEYSPNNKFALINTGIAYIQKKEYDQAEEELNTLLRLHPGYTQGLLTRGNMYVEKGDTIKAYEDYHIAIENDKYFPPGYSMRAILYYSQKKYEEALADLNEAIYLDPLPTGNYINRGLVKYYLNDLRGAMTDYDVVIEREPHNIIARMNRGLLRAQVGDDNRGIEDFDVVIQHEPDNYIAILNRALLKENIYDYKGALEDLNIVLEEYPDFYQGYYFRSEIKRQLNDLRGAERDYLYARNAEYNLQYKSDEEEEKQKQTREQSDKDIDKFNLLVVADVEEQQKTKYNSETRGRIQDRQVRIDLEPRFIVSYYEKTEELKRSVHFSILVDELNKQGIFSRNLKLTNKETALDQEQIDIHFKSIDEYSKLIADSAPNAYYYFGRGMDYMLVQDFTNAIEDFTKAIEINPEFTLAYFNMAIVYAKQVGLDEQTTEYSTATRTNVLPIKNENAVRIPGIISSTEATADKKIENELIIKNYTKAIELNPDFVYPYYNRAEVLSKQQDYRAAILDYNEVIKRNPDFAEAYYNRGLNRLQIGDTERGLADLRKAGELGIVNAYSIIKRMTE